MSFPFIMNSADAQKSSGRFLSMGPERRRPVSVSTSIQHMIGYAIAILDRTIFNIK